MEPVQQLKISATSNPNSVAGAIVPLIKENEFVEMQAIGAGALNQAIKGIAIARGFVAPLGINLVCIPTFVDVTIDGESRTAIRLTIRKLKF